jgi:hypothetical protein
VVSSWSGEAHGVSCGVERSYRRRISSLWKLADFLLDKDVEEDISLSLAR